MTKKSLHEYSQSQRERLRFIDFYLFFLGTLNRNDLISRFGIKTAAATRDVAYYRDLAPTNVEYDSVAKSYTKSIHFRPLFDYEVHSTLRALASGVGGDTIIDTNSLIPCETPLELAHPNVEILAALTNAIAMKKVAIIKYHSTSSGESTREFVPCTLVNNGLRWHVRGYDRKRERFSDFVLTRFLDVKLSEELALPHEIRESDNQWNRVVELDLVPHPNQAHQEAIALDHAMTEGVLRLSVRAAVAGYLLRLWNIDCSPDHRLKGDEYQLWLKNTLTLYGVDSRSLAPGYIEVS